MTGRSVHALRVAAEVTWIASMPASPQQRAEALLEPLRRVVPYAGAWVSLLDPERREQPPLVTQGFSDGFIRYAQSPAGVAEIERLGLQQRGALRHGDLPIRRADVPAWTRYLEPEGFRGGLSAALFTRDGRYLGLLGLTTDSAAHPTGAARDLVGLLAPVIAWAVDPMRLVSAAAALIRDAQAAVVMTRAGNSLPVPGLPTHPLLRQGSPVLAVAATILAEHGQFASFLCPYATGDCECEVRVTVLDCARHPPYYLTGAVIVSAHGERHGLDRTELEILGLLAEDWRIQRIAAARGIGELAVRDAVSAIQYKIGAPTPDIAAMWAVRRGLYIPAALRRPRQ